MLQSRFAIGITEAKELVLHGSQDFQDLPLSLQKGLIAIFANAWTKEDRISVFGAFEYNL